MFDYSETGIALTAAALLLTLIVIVLCRLFKRPPGRIRLYVLAVAGLYAALIAGTVICKKSAEAVTRVGFFPKALLNSKPGLSVFYSDALQECARNTADAQTVIYRSDWLVPLVMPDSAKHVSYLLERAEAAGITFISVVSLPGGPDNVVQVTVYSVPEKSKAGTVEMPVKNFNAQMCTEKVLNICGLPVSMHDTKETEMEGPEPGGITGYAQARYAQMKNDNADAFQWYSKTSCDNRPLFWKINYIRVLVDSGFTRIKTGNSGDYLFLLAKKELDLLESRETNGDIRELRARIFIFKEMWNKAFWEYKKVFSEDQKIPEAYFFASRMHVSRIRKLGFKNNVNMLRKAVSINPAYMEAQLLLAELYTSKGYYTKAEKTYEQLIAVNRLCADAYLGLAKVAGTRNDIEKVFSTYKRLISILPGYSPAYYNLGVLYWKTGQADEAEAFFNRALNLGRHRNSYFYLGLIAAEKGDTASAEAFFRKRITLRTGPGDRFAEKSAEKLRLFLGEN